MKFRIYSYIDILTMSLFENFGQSLCIILIIYTHCVLLKVLFLLNLQVMPVLKMFLEIMLGFFIKIPVHNSINYHVRTGSKLNFFIKFNEFYFKLRI